MNEEILKGLGAKIRLYRKLCGMSLEDLAGRIHKSRASVSKYELGQIAMDVVTLAEIADALGVSPYRLLESPGPGKRPSPMGGSPFGRAEELYLYHMSGKRVYYSLLKLGPADDLGQPSATLYYKADGFDRPERCRCIYHGHLYNHETVFCFILRNYHNPVENVLLNFSIPVYNAPYLAGLICGLDNSLAPTAQKILLSREKLPADEELRAAMLVGPETLRELRRNNSFSIKP